MKFEKQVPDRYGPARVGFDRLAAISPFIAQSLSPLSD
jgi:hypothetical protein